MSQYTTSDSNNCLNTTNSYNTHVSNNYTLADDRSQLLSWLSPLEPSLRHRDIRDRRVNDIGGWLIQTAEFRRWYGFSGECQGDKAVLFCYGDPGVGKTFISSLVVDRLRYQAKGQNIAVSCFYFDFAARKGQSAISMLGSLVKQMVSGMETIPEEISRAFQEQKTTIGGCGPRLIDITEMLQAITSSQPTFMCIDALDECEGVQRGRILGSLKQVLEKSSGTRIFVTGRPHIRAEIERRLSGQAISVRVSARKDDIITFLRARLGEDETPDAMNDRLEADILTKISENTSQMFLPASLNIDAILQESTIYRRRERLSGITDGLGLEDAYGATIERIQAQGGDKSRLGMAALMWISHAERPLSADELRHALAVELGSKYFNASNIPSMSTVVGCCQGLIAVDKEGSTARLIHFTQQEYLSIRHHIFGRPHSTMAEICLTYLNSQQVKAISAHPYPATMVTDFLTYCSLHWGAHAKRDLSDCAKSLALALFMEYDDHISKKFLGINYMNLNFDEIEGDDTGFQFNGLHCASFFGIGELVAALIEMEYYDINGEDFLGDTPFDWAAENGHEEVVKILLKNKEVNPGKPDVCGHTPLARAAKNGQEGVVKILLGYEEVDPDQLDDEDQTPLMYVAKNGHEGVVKVLLTHEKVDPDKPGPGGQTPLLIAAEYGHQSVVKILVGREGVNPRMSDDTGLTPATHAVRKGNKEMMKILLPCEGADPDKLETWGAILLWNAAAGGNEEAAKILLRHPEFNSDRPGKNGRTLLSYAAENGQQGVVKILLAREEVNPDKPCAYGRTPLSYAAGSGREGVVKILLASEEVNPDKPSGGGKTPLSYAALRGHEGVVKKLLGQEEVNPNHPDNEGRTPLWWAASSGCEGVVKILLGREEINPGKTDKWGRIPLFYAAEYGHEEVVKILLKDGGVNPNQPDDDGKTPLMRATMKGHKKVMALLQSHGEAIAPSAS